MQEYGTIISTFDGPSTKKFSFVVKKNSVVRKGQFVQINISDGKLIGRVADIIKTNRYFLNPESVKNVETSGSRMPEAYPTWEWEYLIANVDVVGVFSDNKFENATVPVSPGEGVLEPETEVLEKFFGLDSEGLDIGNFPYHDLKIRLNPTKLLQKHLAILALSGAGKSFLASTIIEELLARSPERGQISTIIIDTHGEYTSFADDVKYANKVKVFPIEEIRIGLESLSPYQISRYTNLSGPQTRELRKIMSGLKRGASLTDLVNKIEEKEDMKEPTRDVLVSELDELRRTGLFGARDYPNLSLLAKQGDLAIIDLSGAINLKKKQIVVEYLARKLFNARRNSRIPPFLLILEEAHQYIPEKIRRELALCKGILQTIAREGRKFNASLCLISQRPVQLSTTVLSQCNTNIILRVTNPYDLKHIGESSEGITKTVLDQISSLQVGTGLIVGEAVNFPLFIKIRNRKSKESDKGTKLEAAAIDYYKKNTEDAKSFM